MSAGPYRNWQASADRTKIITVIIIEMALHTHSIKQPHDMPRNITPPLIHAAWRTDVKFLTHPIGRSLSTSTLADFDLRTDTRLNDLGQIVIRTDGGSGARHIGSLSLWRQATRHHGGSGSGRVAIARPVAGGCERRASTPERNSPIGRREAWMTGRLRVG